MEATNAQESKPTILVIDDMPDTLALLNALLEDHYHVKLANNGERGLRLAQADPPPDLILLDILMPEMDGYEVLRCLREQETTRDIPVIFLTALQGEEDERRGLELGAADYIHKPINSMLVLSRIRVQLEAKLARDMLRNLNQRLQQHADESVKALELAQVQLMQSEKMAAMGQLAAGVAHEINNPTAFVSANVNTLGNYLKDMQSLIETYEQARVAAGLTAGTPSAFDAVDQFRKKIDFDFLKKDIAALLAESSDGLARVKKIVNDLKDFSRVGDTQWEWADLHKGLESTLNIVRNELKYKCTISKKFGQLPPVYCLPSQLNQVFMNLLVNAAQAIETRGDIEISTERADEQHVKVNIKDSGKGIPPENLKRIFEPFFTTKPVGKGTGLGLSLSWGIIERHHGRIDVVSKVGEGTTFSITLPIEPETPPQIQAA